MQNLQALTKEKLYTVSDPESAEFQGHVFAMYKASYDIRSGGACWHDKPLDILQQMNFLQPPLIWKGGRGELTAKQRGVTEFSHKMSLFIHLFDKNSIHNEEGCVPTTKGCVPTPKVCVLTELLPKRGVLSLTLMDQGWAHNPNVTLVVIQ